MKTHSIESGHAPVPMGCDCGRITAPDVVSLRMEAKHSLQRWTKEMKRFHREFRSGDEANALSQVTFLKGYLQALKDVST